MNRLPLPTFADVSYGPHELNRYDLWKAGADTTPLFVYIHGGGWTSSSRQVYTEQLVPLFLDAGISFATVGYRYSTVAPLPAPVHDAGRAIQHIRLHAEQYGIDPLRVGAYGASAGACSALNLALGQDLAEVASGDPVARQSSRPQCAGGKDGQTAIDPLLLKDWLGDDILKHRMPYMAVGEPDAASMLRNYEKHRPMFGRFSPILQVNRQTAVPIFLEYTPRNGLAIDLPARGAGAAIHHSEMGRRLKARMDELGRECRFVLRSQQEERFTVGLEFFKEKLLG
jgi:arylformamidase